MKKSLYDVKVRKAKASEDGAYIVLDVANNIQLGYIDRVVSVNNRRTGTWCYTRFSDNKTVWNAGNSWEKATIRLAKSLGYKDEK